MTICSISGCGRTHLAQGFCPKHYTRWRRHGDPLGGRTDWGAPMQWLRDHVQHQGSECLTWPYARDQNGYSVIRINRRNHRAHRIMCEMAHGSSPTPKHDTAHDCGQGHAGCVNPGHLRWDTRAGNFADKLEHGTHNRGERCPVAKLTEADVREIRSMIGRVTMREIAEQFGISQPTISDIKARRSWFWLD